MMKNEEYYLGLDIGTNSVGWAVTDTKYNLLKTHGKALWGIRLFDEAERADERRMHRSARRRIQRKEARIKILQELFAEEIAKVDPEFYQRMKDSKYYEEDKNIKQTNTLFNDPEYKDSDFYKEFPTIYHLRKALIEGGREYDIRLVYLALHHIIKHRGHFLFEGQNMQNVTSFSNVYEELVQTLSDVYDRTNIECTSIEQVKQVILSKDITRTEKEKQLKTLFEVDKTDKQMAAVLGLLAGTTKKLSDLYQDESLDTLEKSKICFADASYDDTRSELESILEDRIYLLDKIKAIYDWGVLTDVLQGQQFISYAKVSIYEKHKSDLALLKKLTKKYCSEEYNNIFKVVDKKIKNYCAYAGVAKKSGKKVYIENKCSKEDFCGYLNNIFKNINNNDEELLYMKKELEQFTFIPKQVSKDNGVIPYQVHEMELNTILKNASVYLGFLVQKDETGFTVADKIHKTFMYRIPYYVGPINDAHKNDGANNWIVKKSSERITPWNFDKVVDMEASAEEFITRMTNKCTYLIGEDVLPKNSLIYSEFMVLNEVNNIRINQEKIPNELKQDIYENLFKKYRKVTKKRLLNFLKAQGYDVLEENVSGFDGDFKGSLSSYLDFRSIFGDKIEQYMYQQIAEQIILWGCLYGDDRRLLKNRVQKEYGDVLTQEEIQKAVKKKYTGWGRFSRKFLCEIEGADKSTGEVCTIIQALRDTTSNLMMLLSQNYTYLEVIDKYNHVEDDVCEITYDCVNDLYVSPAVKHMLWQTLRIVKELAEIIGHEPKKVFIEMARGKEDIKTRKDSRKKKLYDLYKACKDETREWCDEIEHKEDGDFRSDRLYLYYTQNGRCMYTGHEIPLDKLFDKNIYDIDHIYPQSRTKDDSLDNRVLVERTANAVKGDTYPLSKDIQKNQHGFWKSLKDKGFISQKKYERLIRDKEFTDQELAGFIARQIVETQQTMKATADILKKAYKDAEIVYVKARLASDFRRDRGMLKVREVNDYHHAKDAYLNIVVGNVYNVKFTSNPMNFIQNNRDKHYTISKVFDHDVVRNGYTAWKEGSDGTICTVRNVMNKNNILYTRASYEGKGGLFNQTLYSKNVCSTGNGYIPLKGADERMKDVSKYGGYGNVAGAYFFAVEHEGKKGQLIRTIESVPMYLKDKLKTDEELTRYCEEQLQMNRVRILVRKINMQSLIKVNGFYLHLTGRSLNRLAVRSAVQLCLSQKHMNYVKKLSKFQERNAASRDEIEITEYDGISIEENIELYDALFMKHTETIFNKRPNSPGEILRKGRESFIGLSEQQQVSVLLQILQLSQCANLGADLKMIGGAAKSGTTLITKQITKTSEFKLVNQSVTGVYENEIDLHTI